MEVSLINTCGFTILSGLLMEGSHLEAENVERRDSDAEKRQKDQLESLERN